MHLRSPSFDHGVVSFLWAFGLALFIWLGLLAIGIENAVAFVIACVSCFAIFLFVRIFGEEEPRRPV